jgi:integrase
MAVVERKRKSGSVFYAVNMWRGKQVSEMVGPRKREAQSRDRAMKGEIKDGTYQPPANTLANAQRFKEFADAWAGQRTNAYADDERRMLRLYVYPRARLADCFLDDWKHADTDWLVAELRKETKPDGSRRLSDKTIANLMGLLSLIFDSAVRAEKCSKNPIGLEPRKLKRRPLVEKEIYSAAESAVLTRHHSIPWPLRVLNAICLFTGMREGEACGRRWRDLQAAAPLPAIRVRDQYDGKPLKTERARMVPIHPELGAVLKAWAEEGFELYTGGPPTPDDFIVPNVSSRAQCRNHTRSSFYKLFVRHAEAAGVRPRSLHSTRHTFISLCLRGGANKFDLEKVTHNAKGDMIDQYTHGVWEPLCKAVLCLNLDAHPELHSRSGSGGDSGSGGPKQILNSSQELTVIEQPPGVQFPAPPLLNEHKTSLSRKPRQEKRQGIEESLGDFSAGLREANRRRKRALLSLREADPEGAAPGLAFTRGLDAAYRGDIEATLRALVEAGSALGLCEGPSDGGAVGR